MKKIVLLLLLVCAAISGFGQVSHTEGFESATFPPAGWTNLEGNSEGDFWALQVGTGSNPTVSPHSGSNSAFYNAYNFCCNGDGNNGLLITPVIDWSNRAGAATTVTMWMYRDASIYNDASYATEGVTAYINTSASLSGAVSLGYVPRDVVFSTSGGVSGTSSPSSAGWYQYTFTIPTTYNTATNYIILNGVSQYGANIYIDDIQWYAYPGPAIASSPTSIDFGSVTTGTNSSAQTFSVSGSNLAPAAGNLTISAPANFQVSPDGTTWYSTSYTIAYTGAALSATNVYVRFNPTSSISYSANVTVTGGGAATFSEPVTGTGNVAASISGPASVCHAATITLTGTPAGGTWSSSATAIATIGTDGVVTGATEGTATISYTVSGGTATQVVTVNPLPASIGGSLGVCQSSTATLTDATAGGTWSSGSTSTATIGSSTGIISPVATGNTTITYTLPTGCFTTAVATVNPSPAAIGGSLGVCQSSTATLTDATTGGTWSSSSTSTATIGSATGIISPVATGNTTITYTLPTGCFTTAVATVNPAPAAIGGSLSVCQSSTATLTDVTAGGTWSSSSASTATIGSSTGIISPVATGNTTITYTLSTGCFITAVATVNPLPAGIGGTLGLCIGTTATLTDANTGGTWSSSTGSIATIGSATGIISPAAMGHTTITYTLPTGCFITDVATVNPAPAAIGGTLGVCLGATTTLTDATAGGTWSSSSTSIATVGSATGVISPVTAGNTTITYTLPTGCFTTAIATVNPLPAGIAGALGVCQSATATLTDATAGGTWTSSDATIATIGSSTGIVTDIATGNATISYTLGTGCAVTALVTVNPAPAAITGADSVCVGATTTLSDASTGGAWTSSNAAIAGIDPSSGIITGNASGMATITYTLPAGCAATMTISVNALPLAITGTGEMCSGSQITLADATTGGLWFSEATSVATIDPATGVVTGVAAGNATISYQLITGCIATTTVTVNPVPVDIDGTAYACIGSGTTLSDATTGGSWSSSNAMVAGIGTGSGIVTALAEGTSIITYTLPAGCFTYTHYTVNALPALHTVTGGGSYCAGGTGVAIGLDGSDADVVYQLYNGASASGSTVAGSGDAIDFGLQTSAGVYTATATNTLTGCTNGMTGSGTVTITPTITPSVSVAALPGDTICAATSVLFTATPVNGGSAPAYEWYVNGVITASTDNTYSYTPADGDNVSVKLTSNATCATPVTVTDTVVITVMPATLPAVNIVATPDSSVCAGSMATFTATPMFGGSAPSYTWVKNGVNVASGATYTYTPANGDEITCMLHSNMACALVDTAVSNTVDMTVNAIYIPAVDIAAHPGASIYSGQSDTLVATVTSGGPAPTYQWVVNGTVIAGATSSVFVSNTFNNHDSVTCTVIGTSPCGYPTYNSVIISVSPTGVGAVPSEGNDIQLVPNPNNGSFTVKGTLGATSETVNLEVTDMLGQAIYKGTTAARNGAIDQQVELSNVLPTGMYLLRIYAGAASTTIRFMIRQ